MEGRVGELGGLVCEEGLELFRIPLDTIYIFAGLPLAKAVGKRDVKNHSQIEASS